MFVIGIGSANTEGHSVIVVIERSLKQIKKQYRIQEIRNVPAGLDDPEMDMEVTGIYHDNSFVINKKIFSQDRRPTKTIRAHPKLIVSLESGGADLVKRLRKSGIPVEGIWPGGSEEWKKQVHGRALGDDYFVSRNDLFNTTAIVFQQNRLHLSENQKSLQNELEKRLSFIEGDSQEMNPDISELLAVICLPVWFIEKVPYNRPYKD